MVAVQAPAYVGALYPAPGQGDFFFGNLETVADPGHFQQADDLTHPETAAGQRHERLQGNQYRLVVALALVGNGERNVAFASWRVAAEHCLYMGCVDVDIRHHHHHIPRPQRGIGIKGGQQLIVQNLHFPLRAVGVVEGQGMIPAQIKLALFIADFLQRRQVVNVVLQLVQQARGLPCAMLGENVDLLIRGLEAGAVFIGVVEFIQQANVVPALLAPGCQQRVGVLVQLVGVVNLRQRGMAGTAFALGFQQFAVADNIGPVKLRRVVNAEHHLAETAKHIERFQRLTRQRRHPEHHNAPG